MYYKAQYLDQAYFSHNSKDFPKRISSTSRLFANNLAVYQLIACHNDSSKLLKDLEKLEDWENQWDMAFHPDKCSQLPYSRAIEPLNANSSYSLHSHTLERVSSAKYLRVTL